MLTKKQTGKIIYEKWLFWHNFSSLHAQIKHQIKHHLWIVFGNIISVVMQTSIFVVVISTLLILLVLMQNTISSKQMRFVQKI